MDLFEKTKGEHNYDIAKEKGIYPYFHELTSGQDTQVVMEGIDTIMIGSNNYLGFTSEPRVIEAGVAALRKYGTGNSGSRFLNGSLDLHRELETELAKFLHKEAVRKYGEVNDQLTKAKKLLKRWVNSYGYIDAALCNQTEQFLKE